MIIINLIYNQAAHKDWIFDLTWLDDQFVVSGSRDGSLALWRVTDDMLVRTVLLLQSAFVSTTISRAIYSDVQSNLN